MTRNQLGFYGGVALIAVAVLGWEYRVALKAWLVKQAPAVATMGQAEASRPETPAATQTPVYVWKDKDGQLHVSNEAADAKKGNLTVIDTSKITPVGAPTAAKPEPAVAPEPPKPSPQPQTVIDDES